MSIQTIFARVSCANLEANAPWYEKLFDRKVPRRPMTGLAECACAIRTRT